MRRKLNYLLFVSLGLLILDNIQAQWITEKSPSLNNLNSICLINDNSGWIVGDKGTMLYKVNNYWINYQKITDMNLYSVFLLDKNNGWAVGSKGTILHFDGEKWESVASPTRQKLYSVSFKDHENGIAVGEYGTVAIFENGSWKLVERVTRGNLFAVSSKNDLSIFGGGLECVDIPLMRIANSGEKKIENFFSPSIEIAGIDQIDQQNIWAVGSLGTMIHFDGNGWEKVKLVGNLPSLNCIFFGDEKKGITVGYSGTVLTYSSQEGWTRQNSPVSEKLNGASVSEKKYYAVGNNGTIISWQPVPDNILSSAASYNYAIKIDSYPNPCDDILNVIIPEKDGLAAGIISITNTYGQIVLRKNFDSAYGGQVCQIYTSDLNDGLYMVNIKFADNKTASGKFLVKH